MSQRKHQIPYEHLSSMLANDKKPKDLIGQNGLFKQLAELLVEKALEVNKIKVSSSSSGALRAVPLDAP